MDNKIDPIDKFLDDSICDDDASYTPKSLVVQREDIDCEQHDSVSQNAMDDYEVVRRNLKQIIETNVNAMTELAKVAGDSGSPRAYEVLNAMMKQMVSANESLIGIHGTVKTLLTNKESESKVSAQTMTQNNFYSGSTEDLLKMLESKTITIDGNETDAT